MRKFIIIGVLVYSYTNIYGVELNYEALIKRSDPWEFVNKIPRIKYPKIISSRSMLNSIACYEIIRKKVHEVVTRPM